MKDRITHYTIENGRGATYSNSKIVVYGHGTYPRGSVLAGQPLRKWIDSFATIEEAKEKFPKAQVLVGVGTTYVDIDSMVSHLPDEQDY